jgi:hypothetical protein
MGGDKEITQNFGTETSCKWLNGWLRMREEENIKVNLEHMLGEWAWLMTVTMAGFGMSCKES